jgi:hypothetical protein
MMLLSMVYLVSWTYEKRSVYSTVGKIREIGVEQVGLLS